MENAMQQNKWVTLLISFLFVVGFNQTAISNEGPPPVPVETTLPKVETIDDVTVASGVLLADSAVMITPEVPGRIKQVGFTDGSQVNLGDLLYELDNALLQAEVSQAQALFDNSQSQYDRQAKLVEGGSGNISSRDDAKAQLAVAKASLELAQARLAQMSIKAPFAGTVGLSKVEVGDYVIPGAPLVNLVDLDPLKVDFKIPETYLNRVRTGQAIYLKLAGFEDKDFTGEVVAIDPAIDPSMHSLSIRGKLPNPGKQLRPGLFTQVSLVLETRENALLVPESSIQLSKDGPFVYVIQDDSAVMTPVTIGARKDSWVEIIKGIDMNTRVVISGQNRLYNGAKTYPSQS